AMAVVPHVPYVPTILNFPSPRQLLAPLLWKVGGPVGWLGRLQVACFTHAMRLDGVGKLIPNDRGRPHRTGVKKGEHPRSRKTFGRSVSTSLRGGRNPSGAGAIQTSRPAGFNTAQHLARTSPSTVSNTTSQLETTRAKSSTL